MAAYQNAKIYKILNDNDPNDFYIGSTKNELRKRWGWHRTCVVQNQSTRLYDRMRELGRDNFHIVLLEAWPCKSRDHLRQREDHWIVQLKPTLNKNRAFLTEEENIENRIAANKQYREENPEYWKERAKVYHADNKEKIHALKSALKQCEVCSEWITSACYARHKRLKHPK